MERSVEALRAGGPHVILVQGELPKSALLAAFTAEAESSLFATMSFWQGVDVPGPTLSLVVIDRIPFPRPDDPLIEARREQAGPAAFQSSTCPAPPLCSPRARAASSASAEDRGVVAVLDPRLATASYRWS